MSQLLSMHSSLEAQKSAMMQEGFVTAETREDRLDRLMSVLLKYETDICDALMSDYGYRSEYQSRFSEVVTSFKFIKSTRRKVRKYMRPAHRSAGFPFAQFGAKAQVQYQPLGSIGIISPWNFPVNLTLVPLAGVLAAGNRALIKPSELTPNVAAVLKVMMNEVFDAAEVDVFLGGEDVGREFSGLNFDHLVYTGGAGVARHIMKAAAENLVPMTLELGGKSPVIVGQGAKLLPAARKILFGKIFNAGQVCLSPDTLHIRSQQLEDFVSHITNAAGEMFPEGRAHKDFVSVINSRHGERIKSYIQEARAAGAEVVSLGPFNSEHENMVPVTLIIDPPSECKVTQDEIFGPILLVKTYDDFHQLVASLNLEDKPLALYYFGSDKLEQKIILQETTSGGVTINDVIMHFTIDDLPFGGVGNSGMGAYHGFDGFKQFSHARAVYTQSPIDIGKMLRPPYGPGFSKILDLLVKMS